MNEHALNIMMTTIALAGSLSGCVIETHRDHEPGTGDGGTGSSGGGGDVASISARWAFRNMLDGATTACPTGFDTVMLVAQEIDDRGAPIGDPLPDYFDCDARSGESFALPPGVFQAWIEVRTHDLTRLYAQSLSQILDVRKVDQVLDTDVLNDGGYFLLSWDLVGKTSNRPLECSTASVAKVDLFSVSVASADRAYDDPLTCEDHQAVTRGLLQGDYTISINALAGDTSVGRAAMLTTKTIRGQNAITDLGVIQLPIDGL